MRPRILPPQSLFHLKIAGYHVLLHRLLSALYSETNSHIYLPLHYYGVFMNYWARVGRPPELPLYSKLNRGITAPLRWNI